MSYRETVIAAVNKVLEDRVISVPTGDPAPIPVAGYMVDGPISVNVAGKDLYLEYRIKEVVV